MISYEQEKVTAVPFPETLMHSETDIGLIYKDFREPLKAFIGKRIRNHASTEDLLHDVFLKIHKEINSLKEHEKLAPWIYTIARNVIIDFYRKRREAEQPSENLVEDQQSINDIPERLAPIVRGMIERLPEMYRHALILADMEGIKQKDIAAKLGISFRRKIQSSARQKNVEGSSA